MHAGTRRWPERPSPPRIRIALRELDSRPAHIPLLVPSTHPCLSWPREALPDEPERPPTDHLMCETSKGPHCALASVITPNRKDISASLALTPTSALARASLSPPHPLHCTPEYAPH